MFACCAVTVMDTPFWYQFAAELIQELMKQPMARPHLGKWWPHNHLDVVRATHKHHYDNGDAVNTVLDVRDELKYVSALRSLSFSVRLLTHSRLCAAWTRIACSSPSS